MSLGFGSFFNGQSSRILSKLVRVISPPIKQHARLYILFDHKSPVDSQLTLFFNIPLKHATDAIKPVPTSNFITPAMRPLNSRMNTAKLQHSFDLHLPDWKIGVARMLSEVLEKA